jgi:hypothetical protein
LALDLAATVFVAAPSFVGRTRLTEIVDALFGLLFLADLIVWVLTIHRDATRVPWCRTSSPSGWPGCPDEG